MKKIAVVIPPITDFYYTPHRGAFLGARYVKLFFEKKGYKTEFFDFPNKKSKKTRIPDELEYLTLFIEQGKQDSLFFKSYKRFGYSYAKCAEKIAEFSPDTIILSLFAFAYAREFLEFTKTVKEKIRDIPFIAGGSGVSCFPEYFEETGLFDVILTGEIEGFKEKATLAVERKMKGIIKPEKPVAPEDIDFILVRTGKFGNREFYSSMLSRGCPKKCAFCSNFIVQGRKFKTIPGNKIEKLLDKVNLKNANINFEDDNILLAGEYLVETLARIKKRFPDVSFSFENGIDYTFLDTKLIEKLIKLGTKQFNLSIGHIDTKILQKNNRPVLIEKLIETLSILEKHNVPAIVYFITGLKNDSFEKTKQLIDFLTALPCKIGISPFYPVPGIQGYENKEIFKKVSPVLTKGSSFYPWNNSLTTEEMIKAFRMVRKINMEKPQH